MTGNNGHAPKRFAETRSHTRGSPEKPWLFGERTNDGVDETCRLRQGEGYEVREDAVCSKGFRGAAPDKQRAVFRGGGNCPKSKVGTSLPCLPRFLPSFAAMLLVLPRIGNFLLNTSPDVLCFFGYSYIMYHVEYYPCGGAV